MIRAFELAVRQLGDPKLRGIIWWSLLVSLVLQIGIAVLAAWALRSFAHFEWKWINEAIVWLGGGAVVVLALMLFPASFGIVISIFMERIADIVEAKHYPQLGKARGAYVDVSGFPQPAAAPRFSRTKESVKGPAAKRGQHTDEILGEKGFTAKEIGELRAAGVVGPQ